MIFIHKFQLPFFFPAEQKKYVPPLSLYDMKCILSSLLSTRSVEPTDFCLAGKACPCSLPLAVLSKGLWLVAVFSNQLSYLARAIDSAFKASHVSHRSPFFCRQVRSSHYFFSPGSCSGQLGHFLYAGPSSLGSNHSNFSSTGLLWPCPLLVTGSGSLFHFISALNKI